MNSKAVNKRGIAQPTAPKLSKSQAGFCRMIVGEVEVIALSDGTMPLPVFEVLTNAQPGEIERLLAYAYQKSPLDISINVYLIIAGSKLVLVDTGAGQLFGPTLNKLTTSLESAGYRPEEITDILLTHIHRDHTGGLMDDNRMVFPNAIMHVERREVEYWLSPANMDRAEEDNKVSFREAVAKVKPYLDAGRVRTFKGKHQLFPGIRSIPSPGHTPGHSFFVLENQGEKLFFWGDLMHIAEVQFPNPSITILFDVDSKAAATQRAKAFAEAAKYEYLVAAAHVSFPGVGHLRTDDSGYRWIPIPYVDDAHAVR